MKRDLLELRLNFPRYFGNLYFVVFAGKSRRNKSDTPEAPKKNLRAPLSMWQASALLAILLWTILGFIGLSAATAYVVKSHMRIDLIEGRSPVQEFLHWTKLCHNIGR